MMLISFENIEYIYIVKFAYNLFNSNKSWYKKNKFNLYIIILIKCIFV